MKKAMAKFAEQFQGRSEFILLPNDPKLSDCGGWRAGCTVVGKAAAEAAR
jgi:hypothetical protein